MDKHRDLFVDIVGPHEFPRFVIRSDDRIWDGQDFVEHSDQPQYFATNEDAYQEIHRIFRAMYGKPIQVMVAPVVVEVFADQEVRRGELIDYLARNSELFVDMRNGPQGSLILPVIDWGRLRPWKEKNVDGSR